VDGAYQHAEPCPPGAPPPAVVHRVHDRFLLEVVEALGLCPFARRSRELGRVHRPLVYDAPAAPAQVAARVYAVVAAHPDAEIVLVTFIGPGPGPCFAHARDLDDFVKEVRPAYDALGGPTFFMVGFHPRSGEPDPGDEPPRATADSLVPVLRRTPDPVIQCVRADVLERVRWQAQQAAHAKMMAEAEKLDPRLRKILEHSVHPDSSLSADIARKNFETVGAGPGRERLAAVVAAIACDRDEAYAPYGHERAAGHHDAHANAPAPPALVHLTPADYRRMRWKNGLGWTTELAVRPATGELQWRVSIAEVDTDCEFSQLPGIDRSILVLSGDGMELRVGDDPPVTLRASGEPLVFAGDHATRCRLLGGATRDLNAMTRRGVLRHTLATHRLAATDPLPLPRPPGGGWLLHVAHGHALVAELALQAGDSVLAEPHATAGPTAQARGEAELVLVWLAPG
jgi:environmental stress-induced protein Ves